MSGMSRRSPAAAKAGRFDPATFVIRYGLILVLVLVSITLAWFEPSFASPTSLMSLLRSVAISAMMFLGLTWIIAAGEIDVSFMSVAALANMIAAGLVDRGWGWFAASVAGLVSGAIVGILNGTMIGMFRLPALVITIATGGLASSLAAAIGDGTSISLRDVGLVGRVVNLSFYDVPVIAIVVVLIYQLAYFLQDRMTFGRYVYAMERNRQAVLEAGVPVTRIILSLYILSGLCSATAGIALAADLSSGQPLIGDSYFIDGLTAVLLGGMVLKVGKPNVIGTLVGILLLAVLLNAAALLGWSDSERQIVRGILLVGSVGMVTSSRRQSRPLRNNHL